MSTGCKTHCIVIVLVLAAFFVQSCHRDINCALDTHEYQEISQIFRVPLKTYTGYDTLSFVSENGTDYTFYGLGLDSSYKVSSSSEDDYCPTTTFFHKKFLGYPYNSFSYPTNLEYYLSVDPRSTSTTLLVININRFSFYTPAELPPLSNSAYINGLKLNGKEYNNVLKIYRNREINDSSFVYYTLDEGIIQILFGNGKSLTKK